MKSKFLVMILAAFALLIFSTDCKRKQKEEETTEPVAFDPAKGKEVFSKYGCQTCHGDTGHGDTPTGQAVKARNYRNLADYKQGSSEDAIFATIGTGVPGTAMVGYPQIPDDEKRLIAKYVVYLQTQP